MLGAPRAGSNSLDLMVRIEVFGDSAWVPVKWGRFVFAFLCMTVLFCCFTFGRAGSCLGFGRRQFVFANFFGAGVEGSDGQLVDGLYGGFADLIQAVAGFHGDGAVVVGVLAAVALGDLGIFQYLIPNALGEELWGILVQHLDGGVNLAVQGGLVAHGSVEPVQPLVFGEGFILKELGLPAVEASETPGGGGDLFDVVTFEEGAWGKLGHPLGFELAVAFRVLAEGGEDDITGEESVGGGVAAGNGFAGDSGGHFCIPFSFAVPICIMAFPPFPVTVIITGYNSI